jgi:hypothetical protein
MRDDLRVDAVKAVVGEGIASAKRLASSYTPRGPIGFTLPQ